MASTDKGLGYHICGHTLHDLLVGASASAGKTRMALVYIIMLGLIHDEVSVPESFHFVFVHPNEALKQQDTEQFEKVESLIAAYNVKLERFSSFQEAQPCIRAETRIICDEWDQLAIEKYRDFTLYQYPYSQVICFTASTPDRVQSKNKFSCFDMLVEDLNLIEVIPPSLSLQRYNDNARWQPVASVADFCRARGGVGCIIVLDQHHVVEYKQIVECYFPDYQFHENETDRSLVRKSENRCFFITNFEQCRGIDHRI